MNWCWFELSSNSIDIGSFLNEVASHCDPVVDGGPMKWSDIFFIPLGYISSLILNKITTSVMWKCPHQSVKYLQQWDLNRHLNINLLLKVVGKSINFHPCSKWTFPVWWTTEPDSSQWPSKHCVLYESSAPNKFHSLVGFTSGSKASNVVEQAMHSAAWTKCQECWLKDKASKSHRWLGENRDFRVLWRALFHDLSTNTLKYSLLIFGG